MTAAALLTLFSCAPSAPEAGSHTASPGRRAALDVIFSEELSFLSSDVESSDYFGRELASAGDINGDGYDDVIVGVYRHNSNDGAAYIYYGSATGIDTSTEDKLTPNATGPGSYFGFSASGAGDINGDGYDDVVIGAYKDGSTYDGRAHVYYGSASGIDTSSAEAFSAGDNTSDAFYGYTVSGAGDVDGDGYADVLVGAHFDSDGAQYAGAVYVYYGSSSGLDVGSESKLIGDLRHLTLGSDLAPAGDVNGDGYDDVVFGAANDETIAPDAGAAFVYYGSASGLSLNDHDKLFPVDTNSGQGVGDGVSGAGDLNGDGYDDVVLGAAGNISSTGTVIVFYGSSGGIDGQSGVQLSAQDPDPGAQFGFAVAGLGDSNGDGYDDLLIGAGSDSDGLGAAYLFYGSTSGVTQAGQDKITASDGLTGDYFGLEVAGAGDVNGDGLPDMLVGAPYADYWASRTGLVYVYAFKERDDDGDGVGVSTDCDDGDASVGGPDAWYADADGDGFGDAGSVTESCSEVSGHVFDATDCDDGEASANPDGVEECDGIDNDCNGLVDDEAVDVSTWYADADGDGFGDAGSEVVGCDPGEGWVEDATDCDDSDEAVSPDGEDVCGDGIDSDCDGIGGPDGDEDGDGLSWTEEDDIGTDDCNEDTDGDGLSDSEDDDPLTPAVDDEDDDKTGCGSKQSSALLLLLGGLALPRRRRQIS